MSERKDDLALINDIAKGNDRSLKLLYDTYASKAFNTIISFTKNEEDAEELLQDVFMSVVENACTFRGDSTLSTWIYRMAVNKSLDFLRKKNTQKRYGIFTSIYKKDSTELHFDKTDFVHPGVRLEQKENAKILFSVIDQLSENQKTAFLLTQVEGLPQQEVADIMKVTRKSVASLLQRAKANLKKELERLYPSRGINKKRTSKVI
ncbi:MAG: RNA polymerase sigma factor (sigma-70 family) [Cyclobacteriaceae bacterium]|jgi:RNA polymerase sigma-70 factor (ECF subfamily)